MREEEADAPNEEGPKEELEDDGVDDDVHHHIENGCYGRGIREDFKRTVGTHWVEEMINFNQQTVAVSFFIFFAAIAPAISKFYLFSSVNLSVTVTICVTMVRRILLMPRRPFLRLCTLQTSIY